MGPVVVKHRLFFIIYLFKLLFFQCFDTAVG